MFVPLAPPGIPILESVLQTKPSALGIETADRMKSVLSQVSVSVPHHFSPTPRMVANVRVHARGSCVVLTPIVLQLIPHSVSARLDIVEIQSVDAKMLMNVHKILADQELDVSTKLALTSVNVLEEPVEILMFRVVEEHQLKRSV